MVKDIDGNPFSLWNGRVLVACNEKLAKQVYDSLNEAVKELENKKTPAKL